MKYKILTVTIIVVIILLVGLILATLNLQKNQNKQSTLLPPQINSNLPTILPTIDTSPNSLLITPTPKMGSINGRLCFPSDFVPAGFVQAMDTNTKEISQVEYKGTNVENITNFTIPLKPGKYYLRFEAHASLKDPKVFTYGYSTDMCPTGGETTCKGTNKRTNIEYTVLADVSTEDVVICDFYYLPETEPKF